LVGNAVEATSDDIGLVKKNRIQKLSVSSATTSTDVAGLRFTSLIVGRVYKVHMGYQTTLWGSGSEQLQVICNHDGSAVSRIRKDRATGVESSDYMLMPGVFTATTTTMTTDLTVSNITANEITVTLEELNNYELTTGLS